MTWFKVDDGFYDHPKTVGLSLEAMGLWVRAGSWCARHLTDGRVGRTLIDSWCVVDNLPRELVAAGLWREVDGGWQFHDWEEHQPLRKDVLAKRKVDRLRKDAGRKSQTIRRDSERTPRGLQTDSSGPVPSRPVSSLSSSEKSSYLPTTTTSPSSAPENDQSGRGSIDVTPPGAEHEGYRWLHATLGTIPADLGSWRTEYRTIGSKPAGERERVALHVQATAWCMQHRSKCTPRHILKHWLEFLEGPRNFELKPPTLALDFKSQREAAQKAATKARLEKFLERENAIVALAKTPADRERLEAEKWDRYNRLDRSLP